MKKKLLATALLSSAILVSCGGGGGGGGGSNDTQSTITPGGGGGSNDTQSTVTPSTTLQGTYTGAVRAGDFATYTVNGNTLSYKIQGKYFNNKQGSVSIKPWLSNDSNTHFWQTSDGNTKLFLSQNLGLAYFPDLEDINGRKKEAYILGLKDITNISSILGKTFVYIDISSNSGLDNGRLDGCEITINNDGDGSYGTYSASCIGAPPINGCWKLDTNNNRLLAKDDITDCANWDGNDPDYNVIAKPGDHRAGFIVDHTDGTGVGIGLEKKPYNLQNEVDPNKITKFEALYVEDEETNVITCKATIDVWYDNASNQWKYRWTSDDSCEESVSGTLEENCLYDRNGEKQTYDGVLCAVNNQGYKSNIMFDVKDGYYIAIANDLEYMEIGAKK